MDNSDAIALLQKLKNVLVPSCKNVGEQLTYTAYKEQLIEEIIAKLQRNGDPTVHELRPELIRVDQQKIAQDVINRTFDIHMKILRSKARKLEIECEKWKRVALSRIPESEAYDLFLNVSGKVSEEVSVERSTQTVNSPIKSPCGPSSPMTKQMHLIGITSLWFQEALENYMEYTASMTEYFWESHDKWIESLFEFLVVSQNTVSSASQSRKGTANTVTPKGNRSLPPVKVPSRLAVPSSTRREHVIVPEVVSDAYGFQSDKPSRLYVIKSMVLQERKDGEQGIM